MSKKETQNADQAPEKVMTKYDLKMQRRKEEKERAEKSRRRDNILGVVIVAALVCRTGIAERRKAKKKP